MSLKPKAVDFKSTWERIESTLYSVISLKKIPRAEWNDRFMDVYNLCVAHPEPFSYKLYQETKRFLQKHVSSLRKEIVTSEDCSNLLKQYYDMWISFSQGIGYLNKLFLYLNQQHVKKAKLSEADNIYGTVDPQTTMKEIGDLGLELWRTEMLEKIQSQLIALVLQAIHVDRHGNTSIPTTIVNGVIQSLVAVEDPKHKIPGDPTSELTFYGRVFEEPFLREAGSYYLHEAHALIQQYSIPEYMEKIIQNLHEEDMRARRYIHPSSYSKLSTECHDRLVADHLPLLLNECAIMVETNRRRDLSNMYCLLKPLHVTSGKGLTTLAETLGYQVRKEGLESISNLKPETMHVEFVENLINVHKKYKEMVNVVFSSDQLFSGALDKACSAVINHRSCSKLPCRSPELLAKYCDSLLKKSTKGYSEIEIDEKLSQSIIIFKYIDDKDIFQKFYARNLARRLIHQLSHSMDAEEAMINRLKQACGYEFTNKLHRMFTDVSVSQDLCNKFNNYLSSRSMSLNISFSMLVLQAGAWPFQQNPTPFSIPSVLTNPVQWFEVFYAKQFNGRKLTWLHHLSTCEVKLNYTKKTFFITMQTFQFAIMILFEKSTKISYRDIKDTTQLSDDQFERHLQSLIDSKLILLDPESTSLKDGDILLNKNYSNKRAKLKISGAVQKETPQEVEQTHVSVEEDRKIFIQAAIVRIMKSRKVLKHNVLIQEVLSLSQGRFSPSIANIKKSIETLIERQYLERAPNSSDEYSYVA